jgi:hypothetical protein
MLVLAFLDLFDNREKAVFLWLLLIVVLALALRDVRRLLPSLARTAMAPQLAIPFMTMAAYMSGVVLLLASLGLWRESVLDVTILWFFGAAMVAFAASAEAGRDPAFVRHVLKRMMPPLLAVEFLANLYVFPLGVELVLVPVVSFIVMLQVVASSKTEFEPARKVITAVVTAFGAFVLLRALVIVATDLHGFATTENFMRFVLPVALSLALFPFVYLLAVYAIYEVTFIRLPYLLRDDSLVRFARRAILRTFHIRFRPLQAFASRGAAKLPNARTEADVLEVIERYA